METIDELFEMMLDNLYNNLQLKKTSTKIVLPDPILIKSGHKTIWKNAKEFLRLFNRHPDDFITYVNNNTIAKINWITESKSDGCIFQTKAKKDYIFELMKDYIIKRILCNSCKSIDTTVTKDNNIRKLCFKCNNCNNELYL
jgi:translation initiation factor 2 beta subunit (eIF-2beta)/eIF-5